MAKQLTDVPTYPTTDMTGVATASFKSDNTWKRIESVSIYLKGNSVETEEPRKSLTEWYKTNDANIATNGLRTILSVSSWAIVVDITWKSAFNNVRNINSIDDAKTPQNPLTDANY